MKRTICASVSGLLPILATLCISCNDAHEATVHQTDAKKDTTVVAAESTAPTGPAPWEGKTLDTAAYNKIVHNLANGDSTGKWPAKAPYPLAGAVLPFHRVV